MTQEDKQLLLVDLSARLPYGVMLRYVEDLVVKKEIHNITLNMIYLEHIINGEQDIKPYLRPMSSMTEEEICKYKLMNDALDENYEVHIDNAYPAFDWLNAHHFDYRGLIEKGLALEASDGMYN